MSDAMRAGDSRRGAKGFTLIELLVVIAIIAILAAILFPVFTSARIRAKATACTSNLKQIGQAFQMYLDNFNDVYPSSHFGAHIFQLEPCIRQMRMTGVDDDGGNADPTQSATKKPALTVWLCPAAPPNMYYNVQADWWSSKGLQPPWRKYGIAANEVKVFTSYVTNGDILSGNNVIRSSSRLRKPSHTVMMVDTGYWYNRQKGLGTASTAAHPTGEPWEVCGFNNRSEGSWGAPVVRGSLSQVFPQHGGTANVLWADGRVSTESRAPNLDKWVVPGP